MKKLLTALLICTMTISLFGCEERNLSSGEYDTDGYSYHVAKLLQAEMEADRSKDYGMWSNIGDETEKEYDVGTLCVVENEASENPIVILFKEAWYTELNVFSLNSKTRILCVNADSDFDVYKTENGIGLCFERGGTYQSYYNFFEFTDGEIAFDEERFSFLDNKRITEDIKIISDNVNWTYYGDLSGDMGSSTIPYYRFKDNTEYVYSKSNIIEDKKSFYNDVISELERVESNIINPKTITLKNTDFASFDTLVQALKPIDENR